MAECICIHDLIDRAVREALAAGRASVDGAVRGSDPRTREEPARHTHAPAARARASDPGDVVLRGVVTERDVIALHEAGHAQVRVSGPVTPLARDTARERGLRLVSA